MSKTSICNRKIIKFLKSICDEGSFHMRKKTGHPVCVATYGGEKRIFTLSNSPCTRYQKHMKPTVNRFVRSLSIKPKPTFSF